MTLVGTFSNVTIHFYPIYFNSFDLIHLKWKHNVFTLTLAWAICQANWYKCKATSINQSHLVWSLKWHKHLIIWIRLNGKNILFLFFIHEQYLIIIMVMVCLVVQKQKSQSPKTNSFKQKSTANEFQMGWGWNTRGDPH